MRACASGIARLSHPGLEKYLYSLKELCSQQIFIFHPLFSFARRKLISLWCSCHWNITIICNTGLITDFAFISTCSSAVDTNFHKYRLYIFWQLGHLAPKSLMCRPSFVYLIWIKRILRERKFCWNQDQNRDTAWQYLFLVHMYFIWCWDLHTHQR